MGPEETIAALLDGRLTAAERAALMEVLARSDDALESLTEAMRLLDAVDGDEPRPEPT